LILSICIEKGGTGKSQTAVNLSAALVKFCSKKVLVVDLDPQGTASLGFGISPLSSKENAIHQVLAGEIAPQDAVYSYNDTDLCIMPARHELALYGSKDFTEELKAILIPMSKIFDFIIIDLPPTLGNFTTTALSLSESVIIPVNASSSVCIVALLSQLRTIKTIIEAGINNNLEILGVLACMVNNTRICTEVLTWLEEEYPTLLFETKIRQNIKLAESLGLGEPIFDYSPESYGALDYKSLALEMMKRLPQ
jgi:chromosome partitioning protein